MQCHQLDHMQTICTSLQTDNHNNTSSLNFYSPDAQCVKALKAMYYGTHDWHENGRCSKWLTRCSSEVSVWYLQMPCFFRSAVTMPASDFYIGLSGLLGFTQNQSTKRLTISHAATVDDVTSTFDLRYDTRCYFSVRSKADMSQLNLPHGNYTSHDIILTNIITHCSSQHNTTKQKNCYSTITIPL